MTAGFDACYVAAVPRASYKSTLEGHCRPAVRELSLGRWVQFPVKGAGRRGEEWYGWRSKGLLKSGKSAAEGRGEGDMKMKVLIMVAAM